MAKKRMSRLYPEEQLGLSVLSGSHPICQIQMGGAEHYEEDAENCRLIAQAGTVANRCGLMPEELLRQRDAALKGFGDLIEYLDGLCYGDSIGSAKLEEFKNLLAEIKAASSTPQS